MGHAGIYRGVFYFGYNICNKLAAVRDFKRTCMETRGCNKPKLVAVRDCTEISWLFETV